MAKIIGTVNTSFTAKDGKDISGMSIYITEPIDAKRGHGESAEKVFLTTDRVKSLPFRLEVGMEVEVLYTKFGKVKDIRVLDPAVDF